MATHRSHVIIDVSPDALWRVISDAPRIADWFPAISASDGSAARRTVILGSGERLEELIVTNDSSLRRFQYSIAGGDLPVERHLGTIDVIQLAPSQSLLVYGTEIEPAPLAEALGPAIEAAVDGLPKYMHEHNF
jgi:hypothetical protein